MTKFPLAVTALAACLCSPANAAERPLIDDEGAVAEVIDRLAERLEVMPAVAAAKWVSGAPIADPEREMAVLDRGAARAEAIGLARQPVRELFATQIALARDLQLRLHALWRETGCRPCARPPDLAMLRGRIDRINDGLLRALYVAAPALGRPDFVATYRPLATAKLAEAVPAAADRDRLLEILRTVRFARPPGLERVQASGVLRVGTTGDYAPFSLEAGGRVRGADIGLAEGLAAALGVEPLFVRTSWAGLIADLQADRYDLAIGGISVTPDRSAHGHFSQPYQSGGKTILARCADRRRFATLEAVDRAEVRVVVNPGGTNERYVRDHLHRAQIVVHDDNRTVSAELLAARADAMITDDIEAELQARRHPELCRTFSGTLTRSDKAIFLGGDAPLEAVVDDWLRGAIARGEPARLLWEAMAQ